MVALSFRAFDPALQAMYWIEGRQMRENEAPAAANDLAADGCLSITWERM